MLHVEVVRLKDCVGISEKGFMHPLHCRDVPPCHVIRQEQFFFTQQISILSHLSINTCMEISELGVVLICISILAASQDPHLEVYHKVP